MKKVDRKTQKMLRMFETINVSEFVQMDLAARMSFMAGLGREIVRMGIEPWMAAGIVRGNEALFPVTKIADDAHKEAAKYAIIDLASVFNATCLVVACEGWHVGVIPDDPYSHLPPSLHPDRKECIVVAGKDHFENLVGMQDFRRSDQGIVFGELIIDSGGYSWLDDWEPRLTTATAC